jgi:hypothetical protein
MDSIDDFLTIANAASQIGVSRQRMHKLIELYEVKPFRVNDRLSMIKKHDVEKIKQERKKKNLPNN